MVDVEHRMQELEICPNYENKTFEIRWNPNLTYTIFCSHCGKEIMIVSERRNNL